MNQIFFITLIAFSLCQSFTESSFLSMDSTVAVENNNEMSSYEIFKGFMSGLSKGGVPDKCVQDIANGKRGITLIIDEMKSRISNGEEFKSVIISCGMKLVQIRGVLEDCKLLNLFTVFSNVMTANGLNSLADQIKANIPSILDAWKNFKLALDEQNDYKIGFNAGIIARLLLKTNVN